MAGIVHVHGPQSPEDAALGWCFVCAMLYKGASLAMVQDLVNAATAKHGHLTTLNLPDPGSKFELWPAVAWGIYPPWSHPGLGTGGSGLMPFPVPLCWTHLMAANATDSILPPGTAAEGAALAQQVRGPADLSADGRRQRGG
jgi:hypothetical protein